MRGVSPATTRTGEPDQACAEAIDLARAAAQAAAGPGQVGSHVGIEVEGDRIVTHLFTCLSAGYVGWRWAVTVARASRSKAVTVSESVLLPGPDSLLAPPWVPWTERVRPGDLKAGDLMPARSDDERLVPVVAITGDPGLFDWDDDDAWGLGAVPAEAADDSAPAAAPGAPSAPDAPSAPGAASEPGPATEPGPGSEPGAGSESAPGLGSGSASVPGSASEPGPAPEAALPTEAGAEPAGPAARGGSRVRRRTTRPRGRGAGPVRPSRVLSAVGRDDAAIRWYSGDSGPESPLAIAAPAPCLSCGFMVRLSGPLGRVFGVCANEYAPDDGKVVSVDHGCGAHSDGSTVGEVLDVGAAPTIDELGYDMLSSGATLPESVLETLDHELQ
jgi:hypothetical protein